MPVIGTRQSPIKIVTNNAIQLAHPERLFHIDYQDQDYPGHFTDIHPEHGNLELDTPPYPVVQFRGTDFHLKRIHLHHKAEHKIDSDDAGEFEIHFVHIEAGKTLSDPKLVIGIIFHERSKYLAGPGLEKFGQFLEGHQKAGNSLRIFPHEANIPGSINPLNFFPRDPNTGKINLDQWFYYEGSLTSDPFSEDVSWIVMRHESQIPKGNLKCLIDHTEQEARPVHDLDRRVVLKSFG